jgi:hypothetical protein
MAMTERGREFGEHKPTLSDEEIGAAHTSGRSVLSLKGRPCAVSETDIGILAVKFALADGSFETVLLDRLAAGVLHRLIDVANKTGWKTEAAALGTTRH